MPESVREDTSQGPVDWSPRSRTSWQRSFRFHSSRIVLLLLAALLATCSGNDRPAPKETVLSLFGAMRSSDTTGIESLVNLESAYASVIKELPPPADSQLVGDPPRRMLAEMTGEGSLRRRWLEDYQIVIGRTDEQGDTAYVEVSFLDRITRVQYYNKMQLIFQDGRWQITRFRTM